MTPQERSTGALLVAVACLAGCATGGSSVEVVSQASGSPYFSLSRLGVYKAPAGLQLTGRVCRRSRTTLLSPPAVRLEHVAATGAVVETARAHVPPIYRRADQPCSGYFAKVAWQMGDGDTVRACFDHGRACPAAAEVKAVVAVPAAS